MNFDDFRLKMSTVLHTSNTYRRITLTLDQNQKEENKVQKVYHKETIDGDESVNFTTPKN